MGDHNEPSTSETASGASVIKNPSGKIVERGQRIMAYNVYLKYKNKGSTKTEAVKVTAADVGISEKLVFKIVGEMDKFGVLKTPSKKRVREDFYSKLTEDEKKAVRYAVHSFSNRNEIPTVDKILKAIEENPLIPNMSRSTLFKVLKNLGFVWKKRDLTIDSDFSENCDTYSDADECDEAELKNVFNKTYSISDEKALTLKKNNYILHISGTNEVEPKIAVGLSNNVCEIHSLANNHIQKLRTIDNHKNNIVNVKFGSDSNLLYTGSSDCNIKLWDLRTSSDCVLQFIDSTAKQGENKPLLSFDLSLNNRVLCGGTERYENDAFLLFWDVRNAKVLGGYWESHEDDITTVLFHPTDSNKLASGSTDGLINIYDLKETNEDDALLNSLNTESSVEQVQWYGPNFEGLCSVTHTVDIQLWDVEEANIIKEFKREEITQSMKRKSSQHSYIASTHCNKNNELLLLTGSNWNKGECVRALCLRDNEALIPSFKLDNNKQRIRTSWMDNANKLLITGGEQCILSVWSESSSQQNTNSMKDKGKIKHKKNPY